MSAIYITAWQQFKNIKDPIVSVTVGPKRYIHILIHGNCECEFI
jgi:hypothetical protein